MMSIWKVRLLMAALLLAAPAKAAAQAQTITLDEAVRIALRQSTAIARSENGQALDALAVSEARMRFVPDLRLSTSGSQAVAVGGIGGGSQSANARLSSSVTVFDGFANVANLRGAELEQSAGELEMERTRQDVVFAVISGYVTLIEAVEQLKVAEENLGAQAERERDVALLVDGGSRPIADLYQQQSSVAGARAAAVEAERAVALAEVSLVQTLRLDPAAAYAFETPAAEFATAAPAADVPELIALAVARRPDLAALAKREDAAAQGVRAAQAARLPTVSVSAGYGASYSSAAGLGLGDQLDASRGGSLGLTVSVPLFDGLSAQRAVERANVQVDNARLALEEQRQQIAVEVRRAVLDRDAAEARLGAAVARVAASTQALAATEARYDAGVATLFEVTQARADFVDASSAEVRARHTLLYQSRAIEYYTGGLGPGAGAGS